MLREVHEDETIIKWADYERLIKKAFWFDQFKEWTTRVEYEPGYERLMEKEEEQ